jgi:hypothetical protein
MDIELQRLGLNQSDLSLMLSVTQAAYAILTIGLILNWVKSRHPGVLLSSGVFGLGTYFSLNNNNWWPLILALCAGYVLKGMGFNMGYH